MMTNEEVVKRNCKGPGNGPTRLQFNICNFIDDADETFEPVSTPQTITYRRGLNKCYERYIKR